MSAPRDDLDLVRTLRSSLTENRLQEAAENLAPRLAQYALLRDALATYRALLAPDVAPPLPHFAGVLHPGDRFRDTLSLYQRLVAFGDMPSTAPPPHQAYDGVLVAGVKRFQTRHGLTADGVMGERTQAAMRVPLAWRVRQIELALERLRWLPPPGDGPMVLLNIPMFRLWAFDSIRTASTPALSMNVIVGRALDQQTPVFVRDMRYVILRPYWNVPTSILGNEILPIVARDPGYLEREGFEIVRGAGDAVDIVPVTPESLRRLAHGGLWLRQRPGPKNALGSIKFVFPNDDDVYMHGTPARGLFAQARRDFSHGCVRVEDPIGLATWALANQDDWSRDRIVAAADGTETRRVNLERPIQVVIFYTTAAVLPDDGAVHFAVDLYGHDAKLDRALKARP